MSVDSPNKGATLCMIAPNGTMMFNPAKNYLTWQVPLHKTRPYTIQIIIGATTQKHTRTTKFPKHIYSGSGTNSVNITNATEQGFIVSYAVNGNAGETLTPTLNVPSSSTYLDVFGMDSGSLLSYTAKANSWMGVLTETRCMS